MSKLNIHHELCERLFNTYAAKNNDYGDSYAKVRAKYPTSILVRLNDKMSRLETLLTGAQQQVMDESIDDTLIDIANYCLLELVERICDKKRESAIGPGADKDEMDEAARALRLGKIIIEAFDAGQHDVLRITRFNDAEGPLVFIARTGTCKHFDKGYCSAQSGKPECCADPRDCDIKKD